MEEDFGFLDNIQPFTTIHKMKWRSNQLYFLNLQMLLRGVYDANIQYYLERELDTVTFEILDSNDNRIIATHQRR